MDIHNNYTNYPEYNYCLLVCLFSIDVQLKQGDSSLVCFQTVERDEAINSPMCRRKGNTFMITVD